MKLILDFGDSILNTLNAFLINCCGLTGSEYGYIAEIVGQTEKKENRGSIAHMIKIWSIFEKGTTKSKSDPAPILASSNTLCGAVIHKKKYMIYTRPSVDETIPEPKPTTLQNCVVVPLAKTPSVKENFLF